MEKYPVFMDWMDYCCIRVHAIRRDVYIRCSFYQNSNVIFNKNRKKHLKIYLEPQKSLISEGKHERKTETKHHKARGITRCPTELW